MIYSAKKFEVATSNGLGEIHLQEKHYLTLTLGVKVTRNVAQYPLHHMTYSTTKFEVATSNSLSKMHLQENTLFDLDLVKVTQNVAQYPLHHVTYSALKF